MGYAIVFGHVFVVYTEWDGDGGGRIVLLLSGILFLFIYF